ncbi:hypothetical protein ACSNO4_13250, partial [Kocuria flava]|uniref:hypothetical protein n=1 Tax=Kocuria flava TaxID=446860 RepID=UPI003F1C0422
MSTPPPGPENRDDRTPDDRTPDARTADDRTADDRTADDRIPDADGAATGRAGAGTPGPAE